MNIIYMIKFNNKGGFKLLETLDILVWIVLVLDLVFMLVCHFMIYRALGASDATQGSYRLGDA